MGCRVSIHLLTVTPQTFIFAPPILYAGASVCISARVTPMMLAVLMSRERTHVCGVVIAGMCTWRRSTRCPKLPFARSLHKQDARQHYWSNDFKQALGVRRDRSTVHPLHLSRLCLNSYVSVTTPPFPLTILGCHLLLLFIYFHILGGSSMIENQISRTSRTEAPVDTHWMRWPTIDLDVIYDRAVVVFVLLTTSSFCQQFPSTISVHCRTASATGVVRTNDSKIQLIHLRS